MKPPPNRTDRTIRLAQLQSRLHETEAIVDGIHNGDPLVCPAERTRDLVDSLTVLASEALDWRQKETDR